MIEFILSVMIFLMIFLGVATADDKLYKCETMPLTKDKVCDYQKIFEPSCTEYKFESVVLRKVKFASKPYDEYFKCEVCYKCIKRKQ